MRQRICRRSCRSGRPIPGRSRSRHPGEPISTTSVPATHTGVRATVDQQLVHGHVPPLAGGGRRLAARHRLRTALSEPRRRSRPAPSLCQPSPLTRRPVVARPLPALRSRTWLTWVFHVSAGRSAPAPAASIGSGDTAQRAGTRRGLSRSGRGRNATTRVRSLLPSSRREAGPVKGARPLASSSEERRNAPAARR